jgi:UDP-N-acetylmuramoyl-tripeptide--D-alanyl-D-alanine ligase
MNHAGEIEPLSRLARPHVAVITAIAPVHLEFFGSLAKIADAKAEIFLGLEAGRRRGPQSRQFAIHASEAPR